MSVSKRMIGIRRLAALPHAKQHQPAVAHVDYRVNRFRKHRRASRKTSGDELRDRDREIARDRRVDGKL